MDCPNCNSKNIGKLAKNQYYCWDCFAEVVDVNGSFRAYRIKSDGSVKAIRTEQSPVGVLKC